MSTDGLQNLWIPPTLDGLNIVNADELYIDGNQVNINDLVPYTGANRTLNMGGENIQTSHLATSGNDVVNKTKLDATVDYLATAISGTFLNKTTTTAQTVAAPVTYNASQTYEDKNTLLKGMKLDGGTPSTGSWEIDVTAGPTLGENPLQFKHFQTDKKVIFRSDGKIYSEALTVSKALVSDASGNIVSSGVDSVKITYLDNVSSDIQTQLNGKLSLTGGSLTGTLSMGANKVTSSYVASVGDDLTNKTYVDGAISGAGSLYVLKTGSTMTGALTVDAGVSVGTRFLGTPDGVSSGNFWMGLRGSGTEGERLAISIAGATATGIVSGVTIPKPLYLTATGIVANRAVFLDGDKILKTSATTSTELGYVNGVTSAIQTQINTVSGTFASYLPLAGGTLTGTVYNSVGNFHPYKGGDTNKGVYLFGNNADGSSYGSYNGGLGSWHGIGFFCSNDSTTRFIFNTRDGTSSQTGKITCVGVDTTSTVEVGLASNTTASIKLANSLNHITGNASEAYLFNGQNGFIAIGRNTTRSATEPNLHMGSTSIDASIESIASNGSAYLPLSFYASSYVFNTGKVSMPQGIAVTTSNPGDLISKRYGSADRYGIGQYSGGITRVFTANAYASSEIRFSLATNDVTTGDATFTDLVTISHGGNVGIGTITPSTLLHVNGRALVSGRLDIGTTDTLALTNEGTYRRIQSFGGAPLSINPLGNNVGIGIAIPSCLLDVREGAGAASYTPVFQVLGGTGFDASNIINFQCQASAYGRNIMYMTGRLEGGNDAFSFSSPLDYTKL